METAAKNVIDLNGAQGHGSRSDTQNNVNKVSNDNNRGTRHNRKGQGQSRGHDQGHQGQHKPCYRCGGNHDPKVCRFKDSECYYCKKKGHIKEKCLSRQRNKDTVKGKQHKSQTTPVHMLQSTTENRNDEQDYVYSMYNINQVGKSDCCEVTLQVNDKAVKLEIDTGAVVTVIWDNTLAEINKKGKSVKLRNTAVKLKTYTGEPIPTRGESDVSVEYGDITGTLTVVVVKGDYPSLLGRNWLSHVKLDWSQIFQVKQDPQENQLDNILRKHESVVKDGLGTIRGTKAKLYVDNSQKPLYFKARQVPYALRDRIEQALDRLVSEGTISLVEFSEWATLIVPIVKGDDSIRICGDYKVTVNRVSKLDNYPIPKTEDIYAALGGGSHFSKLDLSQAYQQLELDTESQVYTTISTHKGLFKYNRLPYGVSSSLGIFQQVMENLLQGIAHVVVRVDDILISGKDKQDHLRDLAAVLDRLDKAGVRLKKTKCVFLSDEVV
ncbi:uncharacterized protein K02A2.6-like [Pecten maximus]|uniref:uncharacterized protein K02A2.6-like n=1 Tax=Pecten maximus TaxID=6579 RepID=UPI00145869E5|nr:uncharacterized protein K02A2.6-like [Pecten maximus]